MSRPSLIPEERIIVALDFPSIDKSLNIIEKLEDNIKTFKIGPILFMETGIDSVDELRTRNKDVFLDLKFHDIPSTIEKSVPNILNYGISMFTIHTLGGFDMMSAVCGRIRFESDNKGVDKPLVLGVTVLTSHTNDTLYEIGIGNQTQDQVLKLAALAEKAGVDGLVCSGWECESLRKEFGDRFTLVVPGVRPEGETHDQKRVVTPKEAVEMGADYLVIGRAITESDDPVKIVNIILDSIK